MYGAIIGDVVGSTYEFAGKKEKKFPLFPGGSDFTDDSILTMAVAHALVDSLEERKPFDEVVTESLRKWSEEYPHPKGGYGTLYRKWLPSLTIAVAMAAPCGFPHAALLRLRWRKRWS